VAAPFLIFLELALEKKRKRMLADVQQRDHYLPWMYSLQPASEEVFPGDCDMDARVQESPN